MKRTRPSWKMRFLPNTSPSEPDGHDRRSPHQRVAGDRPLQGRDVHPGVRADRREQDAHRRRVGVDHQRGQAGDEQDPAGSGHRLGAAHRTPALFLLGVALCASQEGSHSAIRREPPRRPGIIDALLGFRHEGSGRLRARRPRRPHGLRKTSMVARSVETAVSRRPSATAGTGRARPGTPGGSAQLRQPWRPWDPAAATRPLLTRRPAYCSHKSGVAVSPQAVMTWAEARAAPTAISDRSLIAHDSAA